jgi:penicillin-binding protein 1C
VSPITPCEIHREILLDASSGLRVARDDGLRLLKREVWEFWPPDMLEMFRQAGLPRRDPPAYAPGEAPISAAQADAAPRIVSPLPKRTYTLIAHDPARQSLPLRADAAAGVRQMFWFAGSQFLGASSPVQPLLWKAKAGTWTLQVLDDQGRRAQCSVTVEVAE